MFGFIRSFFSAASAEPTAAAKASVEKLIAEHPVAVFSKSWCPYCRMAKETLATQFSPAQISVVELDHAENESDIQNALATRLGRSKVTVPQIFISQQPIGGNSELQSLINNDSQKWANLIKAASASSKL